MADEAEREEVEPFGVPDGALGTLPELETGFVTFPLRFGGIARPPDDSRVRVVVGRLGAGKSLYLRRMQSAQIRNNAVFAERADPNEQEVFAEKPARNVSDLQSKHVIRFTELVGTEGENTEEWKRLWRAAIFRSAASFLTTEPLYTNAIPDASLQRLEQHARLIGSPDAKRRVTHEARVIIQKNPDWQSMRRYLDDEAWADVESHILELLGHSRPLFLYIDAIDDNFKYAPAHWMKCQRGLFYAVMDLIRESDDGARLHVVLAIRDIALASTRASDAGTRYLEETHVNILGWNRPAIRTLLRQKVERLPDHYFTDPRNKSVSSWIGLKSITNRRATRYDEPIEDYLLRHTRLVPRDVVILGNKLCRALMQHREGDLSVSLDDLIRDEIARTARIFISNQLAQVANQAWSDSMPRSAAIHNYENIYTNPNQYQIDTAVDRVMEAMSVTKTETFLGEGIALMNESISEVLGCPISLGDILWQNQLLGFVERKAHREAVGTYYSLDDYARISLPHADEYVWNPLVFDMVTAIEPTLASPLPPSR